MSFVLMTAPIRSLPPFFTEPLGQLVAGRAPDNLMFTQGVGKVVSAE